MSQPMKDPASRQRGHLAAGTKFGRLTVLERSGSDRAGRAMFRCRCECGSEWLVRGADLRSGHTSSCGCQRSIAIGKRLGKIHMQLFGTVLPLGTEDLRDQRGINGKTKWLVACRMCHGRLFVATSKQIRSGTARCECSQSAYTSWRQMIQRCTNKNHHEYHRYGGRGLSVCERWRKSFLSFLIDMGLRPEGTSIHRINNDDGYKPENCRWATAEEQAQGRGKSGV
jgi:hypothetical protein